MMISRLAPAMLVVYFAVVGMLAACGAIGQQQPESPEDVLRYGQATLTAVYGTIADQVQARAMPLDDARRYKRAADTAAAHLEVVDAAIVAKRPLDEQTARTRLQMAIDILRPLLLELQKRYPPKRT